MKYHRISEQVRSWITKKLKGMYLVITKDPEILLIISVFSFLIISFMLSAKAKRYGDGGEYYLMLESFANHTSFDLQDTDWREFEQIMSEEGDGTRLDNFFIWKDYPYSGYYLSNNSKYFCYHFWLYSLTNYPVKVLLHKTGLGELKVFQITNSLIIGFTLITSFFLIKSSKLKKLILILLIIFNPILWYVHWTHPEVFTYSVVLISLLLFFNDKYYLAIFLSSLGSTQNPPIIFLSFFYVFWSLFIKTSLKNLRETALSILKASIAFLPTSIPLIFYYINFHCLNLIQQVGGSNFSDMSIGRSIDLLIDPSMGIFAYMPFIAVFVFIIVIINIYKLLLNLIKTKSICQFLQNDMDLIKLLLLVVVMFLQLIFSTSNNNWNNGTTGPSRYVLWAIVPFILIILIHYSDNIKHWILYSCLIIGLSANIFIVSYFGFLIPSSRTDYITHSYLAKYILDYAPNLYNPTKEIFIEKTSHTELPNSKELIIYKNKDGKCRKALINKTDQNLQGLVEECGNSYRYDKCYNDNYCYLSY